MGKNIGVGGSAQVWLRLALCLPKLAKDGAVVPNLIQHVLVPLDALVHQVVHGTEALHHGFAHAKSVQF